MAHPAQHVYETGDEMLKNLKAMSEKHPEAKIGGAASTFNSC